MYDVRTFTLTSKNDPSMLLDLMDLDTFGSDPSDFGVTVKGTTYTAGQDTFVINKSVEFKSIKFTLILGAESDNPYRAYKDVVKKLNAKELQLHYTVDNVESVRDVILSSISKGEINSDMGVIKSTLELKPLTPWYKWVNMTQKISTARFAELQQKIKIALGLSSTPTYAGQGKYIWEFDTSACIQLVEHTTIPIDLTYEIKPDKLNELSIKLFDKNFDLIEDCVVKYDFLKYDVIHLYSDFSAPKITVTRNGVTTDLITKMSTKTTGMIRIPCDGFSYMYIGNFGYTASDKILVRIEEVTV